MSSPSATGGAYCDYRSGVSGYGREGLERREGSRGAEESGNANYGSQAVSQSPPSSITHMRPIGRRGGLSESFQQIDNNLSREKYTGHDYYNNNNDTDVTNNIYQDGVGRSNDVNVNAAALAEGDATAGRDKTITHFTANAALPAIYQPNRSASQSPQDHADEEDYAPDSTAHPPLQIRYTPHSRQGSLVSQPRQGSVTGLQIRTDIAQPASSSSRPAAIAVREPELHNAISSYNLDSASTAVSNVSLTPSNNLRKAISAASLNSSLSPNGALGSPYLSAMVDITPLPSPITPGEQSPGPWKRMRGTEHEARNNDRLSAVAGAERDGLSPSTLAGSPPRFQYPTSPASPPKKKKGYGNLLPIAVEAQASAAAALATDSPHDENHIAQPQQKFAQSHGRNRSISDFVPEQLHNTRPRHVTINLSTSPSLSPLPDQQQMHREQYLAAQRGLLNPTSASSSTITNMLDVSKALPSPPPSSKSASSDVGDDDESRISSIHEQLEDANTEYFLVRDTHNPSKKRKWRAIRPLGQGTFSKVVLATSERLPSGTPYTDLHLDPSKLVAVKVVEHGPAGGADEERIEVSLKREVDILKSVSHPCIVQLKAMEYTDDHALLVLTFCPGGDLFELASQRRELLTRSLVQRIFAECVAAVRYLHEMGVVHRDVKLESMLQLLFLRVFTLFLLRPIATRQNKEPFSCFSLPSSSVLKILTSFYRHSRTSSARFSKVSRLTTNIRTSLSLPH